MDNLKDYKKQIKILNDAIAEFKSKTISEYNEKYKEFIDKKVKLTFNCKFKKEPCTVMGFFTGFICDGYTTIRPKLLKIKKDGTPSVVQEWFYFDCDYDFEFELI